MEDNFRVLNSTSVPGFLSNKNVNDIGKEALLFFKGICVSLIWKKMLFFSLILTVEINLGQPLSDGLSVLIRLKKKD